MLRWFVAALLTVDRSSKSPSTYTGVLRTDAEICRIPQRTPDDAPQGQ
jgi:hypothetical protein